MKTSKKTYMSAMALLLLGATAATASICDVNANPRDCPATVSQKSKQKKEKYKPADLGKKAHSNGADNLGALSTHQQGVVLQTAVPTGTTTTAPVQSSSPQKPKYKGASSTGTATAAPVQSSSQKKANYKGAGTGSTGAITSSALTTSKMKLQKYHETKAHSIQTVSGQQQMQQQVQQQQAQLPWYFSSAAQLQQSESLIVPPTVAGGAVNKIVDSQGDQYSVFLKEGGQKKQIVNDELRQTAGYSSLMNPDGTLTNQAKKAGYSLVSAGHDSGYIPLVRPGAPLPPQTQSSHYFQTMPDGQMAEVTPQSLVDRGLLQVNGSISNQAVRLGIVRAVGRPENIQYFMPNPRTGQTMPLTDDTINRLMTGGMIRPDGSLSSSTGHISAVVQQTPTPVPGQTPAPTLPPQLTPQRLPQQQPDQVPNQIVQQTPTPQQIQAPPLQPDKVPPQIIQKAPTVVWRPADHPIQDIHYFVLTDGVPKKAPSALIQQNSLLTNPDGTLTPYAQQQGWTMVVMGPGKVSKSKVPPDPGQMQVPTPQQPQVVKVPTPQVVQVPPQPGQMQVPTPQTAHLGPGKKSKVPVPPDPGQAVVQMPDPTPSTTPQTPAPNQANTYYFHLGPDGQMYQLTQEAMQGFISPDGSLTPYAIRHGVVAVTSKTPPQITPQTPTPSQIQAPPLQANPVPNQIVQQTPTPQQIQAPPLQPDKVPPQIIQKTPDIVLRPADHPIQDIHYFSLYNGLPKEAPSSFVQRNPNLTNPDGTLTLEAQHSGWTMVVMGPGKKSKVPVPPNPGQMQVPNPQIVQVPPQPGQMQVPTPQATTLGPGKKSKAPVPPIPGQLQTAAVHSLRPATVDQKAANAELPGQINIGEAVSGPRPDQLVEVYDPVEVGVYHYQEALLLKDDVFNLVVVGFREP